MKMLIRDCCISKCVMINKIAPLGKVASSSEVKIMEKINAELIFAFFAQNLTSLLLQFSQKNYYYFSFIC